MDSLTPLSNHQSSLAKTLSSKKGSFPFRCKWTAGSWREELALLCCAICLWRHFVCAVLAALNSMNYITLPVPGCFVLRVDKFLPQSGNRIMFFEDPDVFFCFFLFFFLWRRPSLYMYSYSRSGKDGEEILATGNHSVQQNQLRSRPHLCLTWPLSNGQFSQSVYRQKHSCAMGSLVFPILASIWKKLRAEPWLPS